MEFKLSQIDLQAMQYRGFVIQYTANIEIFICSYIASYFCGGEDKKIEDMLILILGDDRMSLGSKIQVFHHIASNYDKKWYDSYVSTRPSPKEKKGGYTLNSDLVYIIEHRNVFAHRICDSTGIIKSQKELEKGVIRFARFKNSIETIDYAEKDISDLITLMLGVIIHFTKKNEIKSTYAPSA